MGNHCLIAIEYKNVSKKYKSEIAVNNISLKIPEGSFVVLMGSSGSGKTTLLKMVNLLTDISEGQVLVFGEDNTQMGLTALRQQTGYVLQSGALFPHRTVAGNIATVPKILGWDSKKIDDRVRELMKMMNMDYSLYASRYPSQLSGGQQQRVGIARALAASPPILLMDEPFSALDALIRDRLQEELLQIHAQSSPTILFVTHDIDEAFRLGDYVAFLEKGELLQFGTPGEILKDPADKKVEKVLEFLSVEAIQKAVSKKKEEKL